MTQPQTNPSKEYLNDVLRSEVGELPEEMRELLGRDYALANISTGDRQHFRYKADNIALYSEERKPDQHSFFSGLTGKALTNDPDFEVNDPTELADVNREIALMGHFARSSRAVEGWQQDKFGESIQTQRVEDNRQPEEEKRKGIRRFL
jgi:hypothetical protein